MIGRLRGTLEEKQPPWLLIDVNGVGYEVEAPLSVFFDLPATGQPLTLLTHLIVKEDGHSLYGFLAADDRSLFRSLLKISGVGAKLALAILSGLSVDEFVRLVNDGDTAALTRVPGIGKKTAERLIVEMRDRISDLGGGVPAALPGTEPGKRSRDPLAEASEALKSLGYKPAEVSRMVREVPGSADLSAEEIIRQALQSQVKSS